MVERLVGVVYRPEFPLEGLGDAARRAERAGFDSLWLFEDCFWVGGIATSAVALAATERITVGLGIMPAVSRNPTMTAMEFATLARLFPGRFLPGIGHGVPEWMRQIGAAPPSALAALEETLNAVRALLAGETVTTEGRTVRLDGVRLDAPPAQVPLVYAGVQGPKSLMLTGQVADGTILSEPLSVDYVRMARQRIADGRDRAGRDGHHPVVGYTWFQVDDDGEAARERLRPTVAANFGNPAARTLLEPLGLLPEADALRSAAVDDADFARRLPAEWIDRVTVAGTPAECAQAAHRLFDAGVDHLVLLPGTNHADWDEQIDRAGRELLPLLRG